MLDWVIPYVLSKSVIVSGKLEVNSVKSNIIGMSKGEWIKNIHVGRLAKIVGNLDIIQGIISYFNVFRLHATID